MHRRATRDSRSAPSTAAQVSGVRVHNLSLVLNDVRTHQPTARSEIASRTGLAHGSLTTLVPDLIGVGLVREVEGARQSGSGRPLAPIEVDGTGFAVIACEIDEDEITIESVDLAERALGAERHRHAGPGSTPEEIAEAVAEAIDNEQQRLSGALITPVRIVMVVAAPLIGDPPRVMMSVDLGWPDEVDLIALVSQRLTRPGVPMRLVNDANMAAVAEHRELERTAGIGTSDLIYLKADTGVGGGAIVSGQILAGANGVGFEPGHAVARTNGAECRCGRKGCLAAEAGLESVLRSTGQLEVLRNEGLDRAMSVVVDRARAGDRRTLGALRRAGSALSTAILDISMLFDPERVVLGGYWADTFEFLEIDVPGPMRLTGTLRQRRDGTGADAFVIPGRLGRRAARAGAISATLEELFTDPMAIPPR